MSGTRHEFHMPLAIPTSNFGEAERQKLRSSKSCIAAVRKSAQENGQERINHYKLLSANLTEERV